MGWAHGAAAPPVKNRAQQRGWQEAFSFWKGSDQDEAHARELLSAICLRSFKWAVQLADRGATCSLAKSDGSRSPAGPSFVDIVDLLEMLHDLAPDGGPRHFFARHRAKSPYRGSRPSPHASTS